MWLVVAVYTGGRDSEVDALEWPDMDWSGKRIRIRGTKTGEADRWVPLLPPLEAVLLRSRQATGHVVGEWGNVRRDLHAACEKHRANIPPCSPNDLRRTFATWMANMGVAENVLVALMGHTSSKMIRKVYARLQPALLAREMAKLTGACTTGVPDNRASETDMAAVSEESLRKVAENLDEPSARTRNRTRDTRIFNPPIYAQRPHRRSPTVASLDRSPRAAARAAWRSTRHDLPP
jgi:Phage integrase family